MTEAPERTAAEPAAAPPAGPTAGALLRQAREAAGLHVAAMAVALKVPVAKLEALEQDRYEQLPDAVFARALASSVCRTLKIDAAPVLQRLPQTATPRLVHDTDGLNTPFRSPRDAVAPSWREQATRPVSLVVGALLLGVVAVLLMPRHREEEAAAPALAKASAQPAPAAEVAPAAQPAKPAVASASGAAPAASAAGGELLAASLTAPAATSQDVPAAPLQAKQPAPAVASAASGAGPASAGGDIVFRAKDPSWIEVRDAKGGVPIRKVLAAGESASVSGARPLQIVVGNVKATELDVRGKHFDLQPLARDNVARFEIK